MMLISWSDSKIHWSKSWNFFCDLISHILFRKESSVEIPPRLSMWTPQRLLRSSFFPEVVSPPKQRLKRCVSRCPKRTMTFLQDQGNSKSTWVRQWKVSVKNHPSRASGIQNSARIPFFTEKCSHGCKDIAIHGMGHNGPHDSLMKDTTETKRFAIHISWVSTYQSWSLRKEVTPESRVMHVLIFSKENIEFNIWKNTQNDSETVLSLTVEKECLSLLPMASGHPCI